MRYGLWLTLTSSITLFTTLAVAPPPEVPEWENFVYFVEGEALLDNQKVVLSIEGWDVHKGTRYPEPCYKLQDTDTLSSYVFTNVKRLEINVEFYADTKLDEGFVWEFFQDDECRAENHPRMLLRSGVYSFPESARRRAGSFKLIDPLVLRFDRDPRLTRVDEVEQQFFVKDEEGEGRMRRLFDETRDKLLAGDEDILCPICRSELAEETPGKAIVGECGHGYHPECLRGWAERRNRGGRDPAEFKQRTGFPLVRVADCPQCRKMINLRTTARVPTLQRVRDQDESGDSTPPPRPNRNQFSPSIGLPSLVNSPGSELDDLMYGQYAEERVRGVPINRPTEYNFQKQYLNDNPLVDPVNYNRIGMLESVWQSNGPRIRVPNIQAGVSPLVPETDHDARQDEALSDFNGIGRSLRNGQLGK
ncbi:hypothetical protein H072_9460 [Dactylellina haptotyla CBS 200.50]|uniref:RING-type domain-containing protein n=1 Tax=Dactylellina haptotyla (strain CBS 200.50) TaxID=1284197 RepID=S8A2K8_DACHA|nr:hypothetical protein H072_9460 [Dactylellina haptotyla CBS 200.50]